MIFEVVVFFWKIYHGVMENTEGHGEKRGDYTKVIYEPDGYRVRIYEWQAYNNFITLGAME